MRAHRAGKADNRTGAGQYGRGSKALIRAHQVHSVFPLGISPLYMCHEWPRLVRVGRPTRGRWHTNRKHDSQGACNSISAVTRSDNATKQTDYTIQYRNASKEGLLPGLSAYSPLKGR